MKKILLSVVFQIGVNVIGIPDFHTNSPILFKVEQKSKFHR
jgi:hypothetical protein